MVEPGLPWLPSLSTPAWRLAWLHPGIHSLTAWLCPCFWSPPGRLAWPALLRARAPYDEIEEPEISLFRYMAAV